MIVVIIWSAAVVQKNVAKVFVLLSILSEMQIITLYSSDP